MSPPDEQERRDTASPKDKPETASQRRERERHEKYLAAINALTDQLATNQEHDDTGEKDHSLREKVTIGLVFLTLIATGVGDAIFYFTMRDAREAAARAHADNANALKAASATSATALAKAEAANQISGSALSFAQASDRAWLAPMQGTISGPFSPDGQSNLPFSPGGTYVYRVVYKNIGKAPALHFQFGSTRAEFTKRQWSNGFAAKQITKVQSRCLSTKDTGVGTIVFPSDATPYFVTADSSDESMIKLPHTLPKAVLDGKSILAFMGCFTYLSGATVHHTAFGFWFQGKKIMPGSLALLDAGNAAD